MKLSLSHCLTRILLSGTPLTIRERINYFGKLGSRYSLPLPLLLETGENSFSSFIFIVAIFNGSIFQRFFSKPIVGVFCWSFLQCIYFSWFARYSLFPLVLKSARPPFLLHPQLVCESIPVSWSYNNYKWRKIWKKIKTRRKM